MLQKLLFRNSVKILSFTVFSFALFLATQRSKAQTITGSYSSGTNNGFFYTWWNDQKSGSASMTLGAAGNYSTTWSNINNFTAGKGWATGKADRVVCFEGSFNGGSNGFLAVYGWTKSPLIEYYVCENHGSWTPPGNTGGIVNKGTFTSDGGTYTIYKATRTNAPNITGTDQNFDQYWSVRSSTRSTGTVTFANHVAAWKAAGMNMGTTWDYQIMESEGYQSSGSSNITISECNSCATAAPTVTPTVTYEVGDVAAKLTATGNNLKWYTTETGGTASTTAPTPSTSTVGTTVYYVSATGTCESSRSSITVNVVQTYKIYKVSAPVTIDGTIESVWNDANVKPMNAGITLTGTVSNAADLSATAKVLWDATNLYVLAEVKDDAQKNDSQNAYDDDAVEFYVDVNNDKATAYGTNDFQYTFGWNDGTTVGVLPSGGATSGITYSAVNTTGGYIIEAKIPWSTIKGTPTADQLIGIDFMVNDDDDGSTRDAKISWNSKTDQAYTDASLFGTAKLSSQQVVTGVDDNFTSDHISVYPNPVTNDLFITGFTGDYEYVVSDYSGRAVLKGQSAEKIDVAELEPGVYIVKVKQGERSKTIKISKL